MKNKRNKNLKSTSKFQTLNSKFNSGITLIALVVTIVVLLILAGITISLMFGEDSIFKTANKSKIDTVHAKLYDTIGTMSQDYYIKSRAGISTSSTLLEYLQSKQIIDENNVVNTEELFGKKETLGNGTLDTGDVYVIEQETTGDKTKYKLVYYEKNNETNKNLGYLPGDVTKGDKEEENPDVPPTTDEPPVRPSEKIPNEEVTVTTTFGTIDIIWLDGKTNTPTSIPNEPVLNSGEESMTPIRWNNNNEEVETTKEDTEWYSYNVAQEKTDSKKSHWANAKTENGSYFVWIPRYAYRITYYDKNPNTNLDAVITGYYDGFGKWNTDGELKEELEEETETVAFGDYLYIVHPAFTSYMEMGGWNNDISGFWISKFKMSGGNSSTLTSAPGVTIRRNSIVGTYYSDARKATYGYSGTNDEFDNNTSFMHSHMTKNSEWGAVAYLAHSQYGRNAYEISSNSLNNYYSGGGEGATTYTTSTNQLQSTTGNPYGVYDMIFNCEEYVAVWNTLNSSKNSYGTSFVTKDGTSTKYATAYSWSTTGEGGISGSRTGDALKEVLITDCNAWFNDLHRNVTSELNNASYLRRGNERTRILPYDGIFSCDTATGSAEYGSYPFRTVLIP